METATKKVINGWAMYDWANSAYNLVITSTIFPAYYVGITAASHAGEKSYVYFFGRRFINTALQDYALAVVFVIVAFTSPVLSSIADYKRNKKNWMKAFCYVGSAACIALFWFTKGNAVITPGELAFGIISFAIAALGFWGGPGFFNSFFPGFGGPVEQGWIHGKGLVLG